MNLNSIFANLFAKHFKMSLMLLWLVLIESLCWKRIGLNETCENSKQCPPNASCMAIDPGFQDWRCLCNRGFLLHPIDEDRNLKSESILKNESFEKSQSFVKNEKICRKQFNFNQPCNQSLECLGDLKCIPESSILSDDSSISEESSSLSKDFKNLKNSSNEKRICKCPKSNQTFDSSIQRCKELCAEDSEYNFARKRCELRIKYSFRGGGRGGGTGGAAGGRRPTLSAGAPPPTSLQKKMKFFVFVFFALIAALVCFCCLCRSLSKEKLNDNAEEDTMDDELPTLNAAINNLKNGDIKMV